MGVLNIADNDGGRGNQNELLETGVQVDRVNNFA